MACCNAPVIIGHKLSPTAFQTASSLSIGNALTEGEAINGAVLTWGAAVSGALTMCEVHELVIRETAATASDIRTPNLKLALYSGTAPTTPTANAVYATPTGSTYLGIIEVPSASYERVSATVHEAIVRPSLTFVVPPDGNAGTLYGVLLSASSGGFTFVTGAIIQARLFIREHNTVSGMPV